MGYKVWPLRWAEACLTTRNSAKVGNRVFRWTDHLNIVVTVIKTGFTGFIPAYFPHYFHLFTDHILRNQLYNFSYMCLDKTYRPDGSVMLCLMYSRYLKSSTGQSDFMSSSRIKDEHDDQRVFWQGDANRQDRQRHLIKISARLVSFCSGALVFSFISICQRKWDMKADSSCTVAWLQAQTIFT